MLNMQNTKRETEEMQSHIILVKLTSIIVTKLRL